MPDNLQRHVGGKCHGVDSVGALGEQMAAVDLQRGGGGVAGFLEGRFPVPFVHHQPHSPKAHGAAYFLQNLSIPG